MLKLLMGKRTALPFYLNLKKKIEKEEREKKDN